MPIYEFYCPDCHTIFSFLSRSVNTEKRPSCPRCDRPDLERAVSSFAVSRGRAEPVEGELPDVDDARLEHAMEALASEAEGIDEGDPRQVARLMRKLYDSAGLPLGEGIDEAIRRLEAGEDPDAVEAELGDALEGEDPLARGRGAKGLRRRVRPPSVDETLYEL